MRSNFVIPPDLLLPDPFCHLRLLTDLKHCDDLYTHIRQFVYNSKETIEHSVSRIEHWASRGSVKTWLEQARLELSDQARDWSNSISVERAMIYDDAGLEMRPARQVLGEWLASLPAVAFPPISAEVCDRLLVSHAVREAARQAQRILEYGY